MTGVESVRTTGGRPLPASPLTTAGYVASLAAVGAGSGAIIARALQRGMVPGAIAGAVLGAAAGALVGRGDLRRDPTVPQRVAGAAALGVVGALGGLAVGAVAGRAGGAAVRAVGQQLGRPVTGQGVRTASKVAGAVGGFAAIGGGILFQRELTQFGGRFTAPKRPLPPTIGEAAPPTTGAADAEPDAPSPPADRDPVVLIAGYGTLGPGIWKHFANSLERDGYDAHVVTPLDSGYADIEASARHLEESVERIRRQTGSDKVDIVAHSEGGLIARAYTELEGGAGAVDSLVTVATPHAGVDYGPVARALAESRVSRAVTTTAAWQLAAGSQSDLLERLAAADPADAVRRTSIYSNAFDGLVHPDSASIEGWRNIELEAGTTMFGKVSQLTHVGLIRSSEDAYVAARGALEEPARGR